MAKRIGEKITKQKGDSNKVLHIIDLEQIPSEGKENIKKKLIGAYGPPYICDVLQEKGYFARR